MLLVIYYSLLAAPGAREDRNFIYAVCQVHIAYLTIKLTLNFEDKRSAPQWETVLYIYGSCQY